MLNRGGGAMAGAGQGMVLSDALCCVSYAPRLSSGPLCPEKFISGRKKRQGRGCW